MQTVIIILVANLALISIEQLFKTFT